MVQAAVSRIGDWLPGTTISAIAAGGTAKLSYTGALGLGLGYLAVAFLVAGLVFQHRDITD